MLPFGTSKRWFVAAYFLIGITGGLAATYAFAPPLKVVGHTIRDANDRIITLQGFAIYDADKWNDKSIVAHWKNHWKANAIRLAAHPDQWFINHNSATQEAYLKHVDKMLAWCKEYQLYVVFDMYHESGFTGTLSQHWPNCKKMWPVVAKRYAKVDHIIWEVYNEPYENNVSDLNLWKTWVPKAQELVDTIRSYNPVVTACIVPAVRWAQVAFPDVIKVEREQIIYSFHPYPPSYDGGGKSTWNKTVWSKYFGYIMERKIAPVIVDEWHAQTSDEIKYYAPAITAYMQEIGASQTLWGYFPGWPNNLVSNKLGSSEVKTPQGEMLYKYLNNLTELQPAAPSTASGRPHRFTVTSRGVTGRHIGSDIGLRIFDMQGRLIYSTVEKAERSGVYTIPLPLGKMPASKCLAEIETNGAKETRLVPVTK